MTGKCYCCGEETVSAGLCYSCLRADCPTKVEQECERTGAVDPLDFAVEYEDPEAVSITDVSRTSRRYV